jgi:hypothetical protein
MTIKYPVFGLTKTLLASIFSEPSLPITKPPAVTDTSLYSVPPTFTDGAVSRIDSLPLSALEIIPIFELLNFSLFL